MFEGLNKARFNNYIFLTVRNRAQNTLQLFLSDLTKSLQFFVQRKIHFTCVCVCVK